jgi:hypothetical protein
MSVSLRGRIVELGLRFSLVVKTVSITTVRHRGKIIMTVKRQDSEDFDASPEQLLGDIVRILEKGQKRYSYIDTEVDSESGEIHSRIKPNWWPLLLSTGLNIKVERSDTAASVVVSTRSQWFIWGDVANFYRGYIKDLLTSLRSEMEINAEQGAAANG